MVIPVSIIIPTADRCKVLMKTLQSIASQSLQPWEIIIVDASEDEETRLFCETGVLTYSVNIMYEKAMEKGAATQRNQGIGRAMRSYILFMDDDIVLQECCLQNLWTAINSSDMIGGVNAMITNQRYHTPGNITRFMYKLMHGKKLVSYAGMCIGPAWNLLPEDGVGLPVLQPVEWLNTTCTIYKKDVLPDPVFQSQFTGYSLLEDVALSLEVGKKWKLYNVRTARIYHDSQPGNHKNSTFSVSKMQLINRHYIMSEVLRRNTFFDYAKLLIFEMFGLFTSLNSIKGWKNLAPAVWGKILGVKQIIFK